MCGDARVPVGMFSRPCTCQRMPQIVRAAHRLTPHQLAAILYVVMRGAQAIATIANA